MKRKIAVILVLLLSLSVFATSCGAQKVDATELFTIEENGLDGNGSVEFELDLEYALKLVLAGSKKAKDLDPEEELRALMTKGSSDNPVVNYLNSISFDIQNNGSLSNGDTVQIILDDNPVLAKNAKMQIERKEFTYTIKNLQVAEIYDAFANVEPVFEGDNKAAFIYMDVLSYDMPFYYIYEFYDSEGNRLDDFDAKVSNGDQITAKVIYDEEAALNAGYVLKEEEKTYTVKNLQEYEELDAQTILDSIEFTYDGAAPQLRIDAHSTLDEKISENLLIDVEPYSGLDIGDTVEITVSSYSYFLKEEGYSLAEDEITREFTLTEDMVPQYISSLENLDDEVKDLIETEIEYSLEKAEESYKNGNKMINEESHQVKNIEAKGLEKVYFIYPKDSVIQEVYDINQIGFLYKYEIEVEDGKKLETYFYTYVFNLILDPELGLLTSEAKIGDSEYFETKEYILENYIDNNKEHYTITELDKFR